MTEMNLAATVRHGTGKGVVRKMRRAGQMPGVVYGVGDPMPIQFDAVEAGRLVLTLHGSERLISLRIGTEGQTKERQVLVKSVQTTPVGARLLHIDFHEVDVTKTVHVSVEVHALGKPEGEKQGGILQHVTYDVLIECLPTAIPERLELDVSGLLIGDSLHVSDLVMPPGVKALTPAEETLFVVAAPRVEEEVAVEAEPGAEPVEGAPATGAAQPALVGDEAKEEA